MPLLARLGAGPGGTSSPEFLALPAPVAAAFVRSFLVELSVCGNTGAGGFLLGEEDDFILDGADWGMQVGGESKAMDDDQEEMAMLVMAVRAYAKKRLGVDL